MMLRQSCTGVCRLETLLRTSQSSFALIRAFAAQANASQGKQSPQSLKSAPAPKQQPASVSKAPEAIKVVPAEDEFVETFVDPIRPSTIVVQLKAKAFHPFYINRYAIALAKKFHDLGLGRPSQVFLPRKTERWTVLRSPHVDKKSREQFERITHKRLFQFKLPDSQQNIEFAYRVLSQINTLAPGVEVRARYLISTSDTVRTR